ncbi:Exosome component 10 [Pteropus alecto]|uniref:Exosome component 10 n=1 Tax=Pteropus alecto TaxID=9402 RepID=L5JZW6_PTEAL|nr:Exosome component 10 [Pteropus alecto]
MLIGSSRVAVCLKTQSDVAASPRYNFSEQAYKSPMEKMKRERTTSDPRTTEQKQEKKRLENSKKPKDPDPPEKDFTPYDHSKSDFKAFAGNSKSKSSQFDPNKQTPSGKKCFAAKKLKQSMGNKSMSFPTEKSDRGFRHNWPKR